MRRAAVTSMVAARSLGVSGSAKQAVRRLLTTRTQPRLHGVGDVAADAVRVDIHWEKGGEAVGTTRAIVGHSLLQVAHTNHIDLEGACEGSVACSTCHVILEPEVS